MEVRGCFHRMSHTPRKAGPCSQRGGCTEPSFGFQRELDTRCTCQNSQLQTEQLEPEETPRTTKSRQDPAKIRTRASSETTQYEQSQSKDRIMKGETVH